MSRTVGRRVAQSAFITFFAILSTTSANGQGTPPVDSATWTGTLEVVIEDDFDGGRHRQVQFLRDDADGALRELRFDAALPAGLSTGERVTVRGRGEDGNIWVDTLDATATGTTAETAIDAEAAAATERRAVVLMVDLADATASSR